MNGISLFPVLARCLRTMRRAARLHLTTAGLTLTFLLALAALPGCTRVFDPGPAPAHLVLAPAMPPAASGGARLPLQLAVALPETGRVLDTDRIALVVGGREVRYYAGVKWASPVPRMVQRLLVEAFERDGRLAGAAEESAGIYPDYRLMSDLRRFDVSVPGSGDAAPVVKVELALRLVELRTGRIGAFTTITRERMATGSGLPQIAETFEQLLGEVLAQATAWSIDAMKASGR